MMKQTSKQILTIVVLSLSLLAAAPALAVSNIVTLIETDPLTGVAMEGYDPVSYFTEEQPLLGRSDLELMWAGVPWHFATAANREVFRRAPEIYAPQYGGYGAMSVARGYLSHGDPLIYTVFKQRLYLFYSLANREAFLLAPDKAALDGQEGWKVLSQQLSGQ